MTTSLGIDPVERLNLKLCAGLVAGALAFGSALFATSVALGAVIEIVNYRVLRRATDRFFAGRLAGSRAWTAGFGLRFVFVGAAMGTALYAGAHPVGLVLGLSMIVPAVVVWAWRTPPPAAAAEAAPPPDDPSWDGWNPWLARERSDEDES